MSTALTTTNQDDALAFIEQPSPESLQAALAEGQLQKLSTPQRLQFLAAVCRSTGLNPLTRPFEFITLQGKITLYARKDATDQLRKIHNVSVRVVSRETVSDVLIVTARASLPNGREDESIGAVPFANLRGEAAAMAAMKAETKAKRRVTLSICGLGFIDESEIADAQAASHPTSTGTTMPQSAEVQAREDAQPERREIETEIVIDEPPPLEDTGTAEAEDITPLTDLLATIADADAVKLTACVPEVGFLPTDPMKETAKKAITARAKALGVKWDKVTNAFTK